MAMTYRTIDVAVDARGVARLTLNRPEAHNAFSTEMMEEIAAAAGRLDRDPAARVVVLTGAGESFCAGGDLKWMETVLDLAPEARVAASRKIADLLAALDRLSKPLIARVNGQAYGGGVGLISVADIAVAAEDARFGLTEVRLGLIPANIGPYVVKRLGEARAREVMLGGRRFGVEEALRIGLIARAVPADGLDAAVEEEIAGFLASAPQAIADTKRLVAHIARHGAEASIDHAMARLAETWAGEEAREGITAFLERRKPAWTE